MIPAVLFIALSLLGVALVLRLVQELSPSYRQTAHGIEGALLGALHTYLRLVLWTVIHLTALVLYALLLAELSTRSVRRFGQHALAHVERTAVGPPLGGLPSVHLP